MAIGERIHFIRNLRGLTQKLLGIAVGLPEKVQMFVWLNTKLVTEHQKQI